MLFLARYCAFSLLVVTCQLGAVEPPLASVAALDIERYLGTWQQVALIPNRFQAHCVGDTTAEYSRLPAGRLRVRNRCRLADGRFDEVQGVARPNAAYGRPGVLQVRFAPAWLSFLPFVWGDYWIMALTEDYSAALIGAPSREYLWILARKKPLPAAVMAEFRNIAAAAGFDVSRLVQQ
jgi:apolipoprotein D and lipocalin family protein